MSNFCGMVIAGVGAAASIAGSAMQGSAAEDAAATSAGQSTVNAAALAAAGRRGDALLSQSGQRADQLLRGSGKDADKFLREGYQGAVEDMAPYDSLGLQGSNALARYLGFVTEYQGKKPAAPKAPVKATTAVGAQPIASVKERMDAWFKANYIDSAHRDSREPGVRAMFAKKVKAETAQQKNALAKTNQQAQKQYKTDLAKYNTALAKYKTDRTAFTANQKSKKSFGDYFDRYTKRNLMADPVYRTELRENVRAWDTSAASRGSLMSGNTVAGLREVTASGIGRAYDRDWNQRERKFNAYSGLNNMGLGVRTGLADARMQTAGARANMGYNVASNRANTGVTIGMGRANTMLDAAGSQANYNQQAADARGSGQLAQGTAYGNAFGNIGQMGMLYGMGAFGNNNSTSTYAGNTANPMVNAWMR